MKFILLLKLCNLWIVTSLFLLSYCTVPCFRVVIGDGSSNDYI